jgi:hypothetical protein
MDKLHSIQQAKTNYENSSSNYDKQFTNRFIEDYIAKYGAGSFEQLVRENPNNIDSFVNDFIKEKGLARQLSIGTINKPQNYELSNNDVAAIQAQVTHNNENLHSMPDGFTQNAQERSEYLNTKLQGMTNDHDNLVSKTSEKISTEKSEIDIEMSERKNEVKTETSKLASEKVGSRMLESVKKYVK